jgi:hypothetical protein
MCFHTVSPLMLQSSQIREFSPKIPVLLFPKHLPSFSSPSFQLGWDWPTSLMFGAIMSATDPVAVVALLRQVGASKRLGTVYEPDVNSPLILR